MTSTKRGRRAGDSNTRAEILTAARHCFAEEGFSKATIRKIAGEAEVDPALVIQYFGSKDRLFSEAMSIPSSALEDVASALDGPADEIGERLVLAFLQVWESPSEHAKPFLALLRAAVSNETVADKMRELIETRIVEVIHPRLPVKHSNSIQRVSLAVSMLVGVFIGQKIVKVTAIAEFEQTELVNLIGPAIQKLLTD